MIRDNSQSAVHLPLCMFDDWLPEMTACSGIVSAKKLHSIAVANSIHMTGSNVNIIMSRQKSSRLTWQTHCKIKAKVAIEHFQ